MNKNIVINTNNLNKMKFSFYLYILLCKFEEVSLIKSNFSEKWLIVIEGVIEGVKKVSNRQLIKFNNINFDSNSDEMLKDIIK